MSTITIDPYSAATTPLVMYFRDKLLATATGFFWTIDDSVYLITNWHNLSGKDPKTLQPLESHGGLPDRVAFRTYVNGDPNRPKGYSADLARDGTPKWLVHPEYDHKVDVVCMRIPIPPNDAIAINQFPSKNLSTRVGEDVFVLGYPLGISANNLPIWKRGSIASESDCDLMGLPMLLVDTATLQGMSGSPVIRREFSGRLADGSVVIGAANLTKFVGVYSGRFLVRSKDDPGLGIVWKSTVIEEVIRGGRYAKR